jgi:RNA polymerase sigma factor (sigma-70 family)
MDTKQASLELAKKPVEELFLMMAWKAENLKDALDAYGEFYKRYQAFLDFICNKVCESYNIPSAEVAGVIYTNTLFRIYEKAENFVIIEKDISDTYKENRLKSWISQVAENELLQIKRKGEHDCLTFDNIPDEEIPELAFNDTPPDEIPLPDEILRLEEAMRLLTPKEREVIQEIYLYQTTGKYTPREVLEKLSKKFKVTHDSIRQIHNRALNKLKQKLIFKTVNYEPDGRHTNYERRNL